MEMAQPAHRQAPLGRPRTTRAGIPASRSGDRVHLGAESSSLVAGSARVKASRIPASRPTEGKASGTTSGPTRRALVDVSNIDKNASAHGRASSAYSKQGSHIRGASNGQHEEMYKHKPSVSAHREVKPRAAPASSVSTSAPSVTSKGTGVQQTDRQVSAKRTRAAAATQSMAPSAMHRPLSTNSRLNVTNPGLRQTSSQPHSITSYSTAQSAADANEGAAVRSKSNSGLERSFPQQALAVGLDDEGSLEPTATDGFLDAVMDGHDGFTSSDDASDSGSSEGHAQEDVHLDDAGSVTSAEDDEALDFNPDPECLVTLPPQLDAEACRRASIIAAQYEQDVVVPQLAKAAEQRREAVRNGQLPAEVAAHEDELAQMGLDPEEVRDTSMVAEYSREIFAYMAKCEMETLANPQYITYQNELHWHMRATLVDWLLQVHTRYHMLPETLFIAINIVDRFLSVRVVSLAKLQLVGVTAMFIAAKYEEIVAPSVDEFVFMTEGGYSKEEIFKGERIVLQTLDFKVSSYCSPYSWVRRISKADDYDVQVRTLAKFLMEMTLLDHRFLRAKPSLVAAISMFLSKKMLGGQWDEGFIYYSGFCEEQLIPGANLLLEKLAEQAFEQSFVAKKYAHRRFLKASLYARDWASRNWPGAQTPAESGSAHVDAAGISPIYPQA